MTKNKVWIILGLLVGIIIVVYSLNFYFVSHLAANEHDGHGRYSSKSGYLHQLKKRVRGLKPNYLNRNPQYYKIRNRVWRNFEPRPYDNVTNVWDIAYWVSVVCMTGASCQLIWFSKLVEDGILITVFPFSFAFLGSGRMTMKFFPISIPQWVNC